MPLLARDARLRGQERRLRSREWLRRQVAVEMVVAVVATAAAVMFGFRDNDAASAYLVVIALVALGLVAVFSRMLSNNQ